jgi:hypothetical protein
VVIEATGVTKRTGVRVLYVSDCGAGRVGRLVGVSLLLGDHVFRMDVQYCAVETGCGRRGLVACALHFRLRAPGPAFALKGIRVPFQKNNFGEYWIVSIFLNACVHGVGRSVTGIDFDCFLNVIFYFEVTLGLT